MQGRSVFTSKLNGAIPNTAQLKLPAKPAVITVSVGARKPR